MMVVVELCVRWLLDGVWRREKERSFFFNF